METTRSNTNRSQGTRRTTAKRKASATRSRTTTAARRRVSSTTSSTQAQTPVRRAQALAERVVLVPVGATLLARENLVSTVGGFVTRHTSRTGFERELKRYERRGATARNRFERQIRRTRTRVERQLRQRRTRIERQLRQNRRRLEREVRSVRREGPSGVNSRFEKLVSNAQERLSSVAPG